MNKNSFDLGNEGLMFTYIQIVSHLAFRYLKLIDKENLEKPKNLGYPRDFTWSFEIDYEIQGLMTQSVVNTAFFFEAYINDYCIRYLGASTADRLNKLDTPSKYLITTQLVWNEGLDVSTHDYEKLKRLFTLRNTLAHPKPSNKGNLLDSPKILDNPKFLKPNDNVDIIFAILKIFASKHSDSVTEILLKQIGSWLNVAKSDLDFYPIPSNAGL